MPWTQTTLTMKDAAGTNQQIIAYTDGVSFSFAHPILDSTGAIIAPATSGKQDTTNASLATIATNTSHTDPAAVTGTISAADTASTTTAGQGGQSLITGGATAGSIVVASFTSVSSFALQLSGAWVGTVQFERSIDGGVTWVPVGLAITGTSTGATSATGNGVFHGNASSTTNFRVRCTAFTSGSIGVRFQPSYGTGNVFAALLASTAKIGQVAIDQTTPGTSNLVQLGGAVPLPTGAATAANQATELGYLASLAANTKSVTDFTPITVGTAVSAGLAFEVNCTAAGNVSVTISGGATRIFPVTVGLTVFPFAVTQVNSSGTTATATYANWK